MRTRAQALLSNGLRPKESTRAWGKPQRVLKKVNVDEGTLEEAPFDKKRKDPELETPPVIKRVKRHDNHATGKVSNSLGNSTKGSNKEDQEMGIKDNKKDDRAADDNDIKGIEKGISKEDQTLSIQGSSKDDQATDIKGVEKGSHKEENAADKGNGNGCSKLTPRVKTKPVCTVNTEDGNFTSEQSESLPTLECSKDEQGAVPPRATRTPLSFPAAADATVPAKRSPLPLPPAALRSALPTAHVPAVRSALPAPPAVRSALPTVQVQRVEESTVQVQRVEESTSQVHGIEEPTVQVQNIEEHTLQVHKIEECTVDDEKVVEEVDIYGFSSIITGTTSFLPDNLASDEDGFEDPYRRSESPGFIWQDDPSISQPSMEMRKRGGPGSRATYRCSRCLAPKKGHKCPYETEPEPPYKENGKLSSQKRPSDASSNELSANTRKARTDSDQMDDISTNNLLTEISKQEGDKPSPVKPEAKVVGKAVKPEVKVAKSEDKTTARMKSPPDGFVKEFIVSAKWLLESGVLEGHKVRYMPRPGEVLGNGVVENGVILCTCRQCKGLQGYNASSFEKHVGSTARHPSDFIFLENGRRLREILDDGSRFKDKPNLMSALRKAVSMDWDSGDSCANCGDSGDLSVRCSRKGCFNSYHSDCAGVTGNARAWQCPDCVPVNIASSRISRRRSSNFRSS